MSSNTPEPDPTILTAARLVDVPGDLSLGLLYGHGASAPPTGFHLQVRESAFGGTFFVGLNSLQLKELAAALRARAGTVEVTTEIPDPSSVPNEARAFEIQQTQPTMVGGRTDVLALYFPRAFPGALYVLMAYDSADRLAYQCDTMPHEFERRQPGYTGPDAKPTGQA